MQSNSPRTFTVRVLRQDLPGKQSYWNEFRVEHEPDMNVISALQKIAETPVTADGQNVSPVVWECNCLEEVCGSCTMVINGRVRQACSALIDNLLRDNPKGIALRPMTKFPVVRDLMVDRSRLFASLEKIKAWVPVDSYYDMGPGPRQSQDQQQLAYTLSMCMTCGCCLEACPQFLKIEFPRKPGESDAEFEARETAAINRSFIGAMGVAMIDLFNTNPIGAMNAAERLDSLVAEGGIQNCGNAQNCVRVCPKEIPLTTSIAREGRAATSHTLRKWLDR